MTKQRKIPHRRELDATGYRELRGLRKYSIVFGRGADEHDATMRKARQLCEVASRLLSRAGEQNVREVLASVEAATVKDESVAKRPALLKWYSEIAARHGVLSPIAVAANFLNMQVLAVDIAADGVDFESPNAKSDLDSRVQQLMSHCDAWHWFHMEVYGEHAEALDGKRTDHNLRASGAHRAARKAKRKLVIAGWCKEYWMKKPSHKTNASRTAAAILRDVNAALKRSGHAPYKSERTLSLVIGEIIREREAAAADIPN